MTLNDPILISTLASLHDAYERALTENDVAQLDAFFWDSPHVVRYGVAEQLYGADAVHAYRQSHVPRYTARRIVRREITTFGETCATVMSEIELTIDGQPRASRQSQTWVRLPGLSWRIVSAHVSSPVVPTAGEADMWDDYADRVSRSLCLALDPAHRPGVVANLSRTAAIAAPLLAFKLSDEAEPAPVFQA